MTLGDFLYLAAFAAFLIGSWQIHCRAKHERANREHWRRVVRFRARREMPS